VRTRISLGWSRSVRIDAGNEHVHRKQKTMWISFTWIHSDHDETYLSNMYKVRVTRGPRDRSSRDMPRHSSRSHIEMTTEMTMIFIRSFIKEPPLFSWLPHSSVCDIYVYISLYKISPYDKIYILNTDKRYWRDNSRRHEISCEASKYFRYLYMNTYLPKI